MMLFSIAFAQKSGTASFYHDKYDGRKAADGSTFRQTALTCASNVYKLGTKLKVSNCIRKENRKIQLETKKTSSCQRNRLVSFGEAP